MPVTYSPHCLSARDYNEATLCASLSQAASAQKALDLNSDALLWNKIGLSALVGTVIASAWAARAAGAAAKAAAKSVASFRMTEAGVMVPSVGYEGNFLRALVINKGRTAVTVIHADIAVFTDKMPDPIPFAFNIGKYSTNVWIDVGKEYEFGILARSQHPILYLIGGLIYRDTFGKCHVAEIALHIDQTSRVMHILHNANFSAWRASADKVSFEG